MSIEVVDIKQDEIKEGDEDIEQPIKDNIEQPQTNNNDIKPKTTIKKKAGRPVGLKMPQTKYVEVDRSADVIKKIDELTQQINSLKNLPIDKPIEKDKPKQIIAPPPTKKTLLEVA
jgi:hypothetical protein